MARAKVNFHARGVWGTAAVALAVTGLFVLPRISVADSAAQDQFRQPGVDSSTRQAAGKQPYTGPANVPRPKVDLNLGAAIDQADAALPSIVSTRDESGRSARVAKRGGEETVGLKSGPSAYRASSRIDVVPVLSAGIERTRSTDGRAPKVASQGAPHSPSSAGSPQVQGDDVSDPFIISSLPYADPGTTVGFTNDYDETCGIPAIDDAPDVVYRYIPAADEHIDIILCNSGFDTKLYIYENAVTTGSPYACNDDTCGVSEWRSALYCMPVTALMTYYIVVDGWEDASGAYEITVARCGDDINSPIPIPGLPYTDAGLTSNFTDDYSEDCAPDIGNSPDVVFAYTPVVDEHVDISLCNSTYDTRLWIYENSYTPGNPYACNDNYCSSQSAISCLHLTGGNTYFVVIDGGGGSTDPYQLSIAHCGDDIDNPIPIPSLPYTDAGTTGSFADDYDELCGVLADPAADVVYKYTPAADQFVDISLCNSSYDTRLWVYENAHTPSFPYACNDDDDACFLRSAIHCLSLSGGNTYYIVVDGYGGSFGDYELTLSPCSPISNGVVIESITVSAGATNVELEISIANENNLEALVLPLVARSLTGGAFWTTHLDTLEMHGRLTGAMTTGRTFITDNVDYTSPDPLLLEFSDLSGTNTLASGLLEGMITLTFDVTSDVGQFVIDTASYPPSGALTFVEDPAGGIQDAPSFSAGVITVRAVPCACDCQGDEECNGLPTVFDLVFCVGEAFRSEPYTPDPNPDCPLVSMNDLNMDNVVNVFDVVLLTNMAFRSGSREDNTCDPCTQIGPPLCPF